MLIFFLKEMSKEMNMAFDSLLGTATLAYFYTNTGKTFFANINITDTSAHKLPSLKYFSLFVFTNKRGGIWIEFLLMNYIDQWCKIQVRSELG